MKVNIGHFCGAFIVVNRTKGWCFLEMAGTLTVKHHSASLITMLMGNSSTVWLSAWPRCWVSTKTSSSLLTSPRGRRYVAWLPMICAISQAVCHGKMEIYRLWGPILVVALWKGSSMRYPWPPLAPVSRRNTWASCSAGRLVRHGWKVMKILFYSTLMQAWLSPLFIGAFVNFRICQSFAWNFKYFFQERRFFQEMFTHRNV